MMKITKMTAPGKPPLAVRQTAEALPEPPYSVSKLAICKVQNADHYMTVFKFRRLDDRLQLMLMTRAESMKPKAVHAALLDAGAKGTEHAMFEEGVAEAVYSEAPLNGTIVIRGGWLAKGETFALPDRVIVKKTDEKTSDGPFYLAPNYSEKPTWQLVTPNGGTAPSNAHISTHGTTAEWKQTIGKYALNSSYMMLGITAAIAAPLLKLLNVTPFSIFVTGGTSMGKTTSTLAAASVVGIGVEEKLPKWNITAAGLEQTAESFSDTLLPIDDVATNTGSPRELFELILQTGYRVTGGMVRTTQKQARTTTTGRPLVPSSIHVILFTSSELSLSGLAAAANRKVPDGMYPRFVEVPLNNDARFGVLDFLDEESITGGVSDHIAGLIKKIGESCERYRGSLFADWLHVIISNPEQIRAIVNGSNSEFLGHASFDAKAGLERRHAERFAFLYGAGCAAIQSNLLPWTKGQLLNALLKSHSSSRQLIRGATTDEHLDIGQQRYWKLLGDRRRVVPHSKVGDGTKVDGWYRKADDIVTAVISGVAWRNAFDSGAQRTQVETFLVNAGVLKTKSGNCLFQPRLPNGKGKGKRGLQLEFPLNKMGRAVKPYSKVHPIHTSDY